MFELYINVLKHSTGVYRTQSKCTCHTRLTSWHFQSWASLIYYTNLRLLSHKNVTFTLQVIKSQANILFPSKYHFPVSIFYCWQIFWFLGAKCTNINSNVKTSQKTWLYSSKFSRLGSWAVAVQKYSRSNIIYIPWGCNRKKLIIIILFIPCPRHS